MNIDPGDAVAELNENNNLIFAGSLDAAMGSRMIHTYLPEVVR